MQCTDLRFFPGRNFTKVSQVKAESSPKALKYQLGNVSNTVIHRVIS